MTIKPKFPLSEEAFLASHAPQTRIPIPAKVIFGNRFERAIDKVIGLVSPGRQVKRMESRARVAAYNQYAGAHTGRDRKPPYSLRSPESLGAQNDGITMLRRAEELGRNFSFIGHLAKQYGIYAFGDIDYLPNTGKRKENDLYREYWHKWMTQADAQGRFHFIDLIKMAHANTIYDGRYGFIHHHNDDGTFQLQGVMGYNIGNPYSIKSSPNYIRGVHIDNAGKPFAYDVYKLGISGTVRFVAQYPAEIFSVLNPVESTDEYAAKTPLHAVLNDAADMYEIEAAWKNKVKWGAYKTAVLTVPNGTAPEPSDLNDGLSRWQNAGDNRVLGKVIHQLPGEIFYGEEGFAVEVIKNDTPSQNEGAFLDKKLAQIAMALDLPLHFVYTMLGLQGTQVRLTSEQAKRAFQDGPLGQKWVERSILNEIKTLALFSGIVRGEIPWTDRWNEGKFMYPAHPTVDVGRESKANLDENRQGITSMAEICSEKGQYWRDVDNQLGDEALNKMVKAKEKSDEFNAIYPDDPTTKQDMLTLIQLMTPNMQESSGDAGEQSSGVEGK